MPSRLLQELNARIAKCRDPLQHTCLRAEKAALLARQGQLEQARAELVAIHARYDRQPNALVSAWVSLAEGLIFFYSDFGGQARDKLLRAHALSTAVGDKWVRALSAAWLAHFSYLEQDFNPMANNLSTAFADVPTGGHSALARASLVTAQSYHWAERFDLAKPWYSKARQHAAVEGDETLISALMHNMAWLRVAQARRLATSGMKNPLEVRQILLGADSTEAFDQLVGTASLRSLVPILRAHVLTLLDRHVEALELFDTNLDVALSEGLGRIHCGMLAEIAWCRVSVGDAVGARRDAADAERSATVCVQPDETAAAHGRLAQVFLALENSESANYHRTRAEADWQEHSKQQLELVALLAKTAGTSPI